MIRKIGYLFTGMFFGFSLSRSGASHYDYIYQMFTGENLKLALLMGTAIIVGAIGMTVLKALGNKDINGQEIQINRKPFNHNTIIGGIIFGMGWAVSGACPGTVLAQLGEGKILGLVTFSGMLLGTYIYARFAHKD
ncbi:MAG: YeeE/YedE thiosulfate transporter family protein [Erysipelotrichaceae bacterium]|nr:YeeE/YedE thiosulfate transporter family protein [Erysipelotrichaceae bacterium]MDD3810388.1 YeeE/YedE thiosulfate transporter family protein [Erysipelotrichaceae bacterium]